MQSRKPPSTLVCLCFLLVSAIAVAVPGGVLAQTSTSPQGGAAVYSNGAVCTSASFPSNFVPPSGTLSPPCTDSSGNGQWFTVMTASLKASQTTDFFISPSLVTGLYTQTQVKGNTTTATSQTATASGSVAVRVLLDCSNCADSGQQQTATALFSVAAQPDPHANGVVFDARIQQLTATLGQAITSGCTLTNTCTAESIDLILSTTSAHTFNFILLNVGATGTAGQGNAHRVTVQARLDAGPVCSTDPLTGNITCSNNEVNTSLASSIGAALFGLGSLTVVPVHLSPDFSF